MVNLLNGLPTEYAPLVSDYLMTTQVFILRLQPQSHHTPFFSYLLAFQNRPDL